MAHITLLPRNPSGPTGANPEQTAAEWLTSQMDLTSANRPLSRYCFLPSRILQRLWL